MKTVSDGLFVQVEYKGSLENGDVFDTSEGRRPLEFQAGAGQMIKGFEDAVQGMSLNEKKTFTLTPEDAYGVRDESLMRDFPRASVPPEMDPKVGEVVSLSSQDGQQIPAKIAHVDNEKITVDLNHPLAGQSLTFEIEVIGISENRCQTPSGCGDGCDCSSGCC